VLKPEAKNIDFLKNLKRVQLDKHFQKHIFDGEINKENRAVGQHLYDPNNSNVKVTDLTNKILPQLLQNIKRNKAFY
jgi:hypothetical protein